MRTLNQLSESAFVGDAITDQALLIRHWLREAGFRSEIYTRNRRPEMEREVLSVSTYHRQPGEEVLIYHHSIGASVAEQLIEKKTPIILIYHNITPSGFFDHAAPGLARQLDEGRQQLESLCEQTVLALADSDYNEQELKEAGYETTGILPIVLDPAYYDLPPDPGVVARYDDGRVNILFLGRVAPNKRQEDLIKLLYSYKRIEPDARLLLVGSTRLRSYVDYLRELAFTQNLSDSVFIEGHVSQAEMVAYYKIADMYISMSEHEGFGKPLIESMYFQLPVMAFESSAVPYTLGNAGILFKHKHYEALAEVVDIVLKDEALRQRIAADQEKRVQEYFEPRVHERFKSFLENLSVLV